MTDQLETLQKLLTDAIFDEAALAPALQTLADYCDAPVAQLMITNEHRTLLQSSFHGPMDMDAVSAEADYQAINPRVKAIAGMRVGVTTRDSDFITSEQIARDQTYQDLILPSGLGHFAGVLLDKSPGRTGGLAIHRPINEDRFDDRTARALERAVLTCRPVFDLMRRVHHRDARMALGTITPGLPAAILDRAGRVVDMSGAFEALVSMGDLTLRTGGEIDFGDPQAAAALLTSVFQPGGVVGGRFAVSGETGPTFLCEVLSLPQIGMTGPYSGAAILILERAAAATVLDKAMAASLYSLTPAETETAAGLVAGLSPQSIAVAQNVRITTVRTHIKSLRAKTESHRQAEIVAKLGQLKMKAPNQMDKTS